MEKDLKDLHLKDLSTRLSYGVKCDINDNKPYTLSSISNDYDGTLIRFKEQIYLLFVTFVWPYYFIKYIIKHINNEK